MNNKLHKITSIIETAYIGSLSYLPHLNTDQLSGEQPHTYIKKKSELH